MIGVTEPCEQLMTIIKNSTTDYYHILWIFYHPQLDIRPKAELGQ